jgi:2-keto-4-pentenoate hydratase/2-oxohepta-3-ene-1,7-dioic acid hydratase in catechol pathway
MKLVLFRAELGLELLPGLLSERGVIDISALVRPGHDGQATMQNLIDDFEELRPRLEQELISAPAVPLDRVALASPLPRPGKMLNCIGNYWENRDREAGPLNLFLKNPDAVIGPGATIRLPDFEEPTSFMHEAELALVMKGPAKDVPAERWRDAVFGYTAAIDVTARGEGRYTWKRMSWLGKSFDTFAPLGPCIVTADEIADPNDLHVRLWNDGDLRHNYNTSDMEHPVPEIVAFVTKLMTLYSGDVISCGTNHEGLGYLQDGETVRIDIEGIGSMTLDVVDPLKRSWDRGIYMGADSTNHEAVKRHKPELTDSLKTTERTST